MDTAKKTPLYDQHVKAGGKMVDFFGWVLPTNYEGGIIKEHMNTRTEASIFDVSHMGEILITGKGAFDFVQRLMTNDISKIKEGRAVYTPMCYENGTCVDDLLVYPFDEGGILLVVNAANDDKDFDWIKSHEPEGVTVTHVSSEWAQVALQGPKAKEIMSRVGLDACNALKFFGAGFFDVCSCRCLISKTGYTGEQGFEIYMPPERAEAVWETLVEAGAHPAGLGCRDTLRFEAGLPLYGHEISDAISPREANLDFAVKLLKEGGFIGCDALRAEPARKQIGLRFLGRGVPRQGYPVFAGGREVGVVTTGSPAPYVGGNLALCLVASDTPLDAPFTIAVRGKEEPAERIAVPFYTRPR